MKIKLLQNKKGQIWKYIIAAIIALVVVILVIIIFNKTGSKTSNNIIDAISGSTDCDKDTIVNTFDRCPCDYTSDDNKVAKGCPIGTEPRACGHDGAKPTSEICPKPKEE